MTFLNKISNPDIKELVENIEILRLIKDENNFGLLNDSLKKLKSNKLVLIKDLVRDILEIKKYRNTNKYIDLRDNIRTNISNILQENDMINIMNDIKKDVEKYHTNDASELRKGKTLEELIAVHIITEKINKNSKVKKAFCKYVQVYVKYVDIKLTDAEIQNMLNSDSIDDFNKLVFISQIYNININQIESLLDSNALYLNDNLKKIAMFYTKMKYYFKNVPMDLCSDENNFRFKQTGDDDKIKQAINDLYNGIEDKCKNVNLKDCQVLLTNDSSLNNKMSNIVTYHTNNKDFYVNHSDKDIHDINMRILNEIQTYLTDPNISSTELKERV